VAKDSGRKGAKSRRKTGGKSNSPGLRRAAASASPKQRSALETLTSELGAPFPVPKIMSFLGSSIVRKVISAGLASAAAALLADKEDQDGGRTKGSSARVRPVKTSKPRARRERHLKMSGDLPKERAIPAVAKVEVLAPIAAPTRKKRSDTGVRRVPKLRSRRADSPVKSAAVASGIEEALATAPSGSLPVKRAVSKAGPKDVGIPTAAGTRKKRSDAGVKAEPKRRSRRAGSSVKSVAAGRTPGPASGAHSREATLPAPTAGSNTEAATEAEPS
jgi:hypothetical protein